MLEIELFQRLPKTETHQIKIYRDGKLITEGPNVQQAELLSLADELRCELRWLDEYIKEKGLDK